MGYVAGNRMCSIKLTNDAVWTLRDLYKRWHGKKYTHVNRIPNTSNPVLYSVNPSDKDFFGSFNVEVMHLKQSLCMDEATYNELKFKTLDIKLTYDGYVLFDWFKSYPKEIDNDKDEKISV
jgi:hypothetical protein